MTVIITVMYPKTETSTFDLDYYLKKHMPLVQEKWGPQGLKNWSVTKLDESGGYTMQALLWFESSEAWAKAGATDGPTIMKDISKFSSEQPLFVFGEVIKKSE
ncbi:hypothetical protein SBOR_0987 [Sclerotinia borealis F-4128]|uniref:Ethyl tert-butyl ether degradation EthD n=1 Tax=Sclerotinia borealis (strain F-4128) TaxID=1432307 RepID=W9CP63_SCLBF|nr:hypothetical protein SBOR_0987 [Sclerotinia borealis F-4128]